MLMSYLFLVLTSLDQTSCVIQRKRNNLRSIEKHAALDNFIITYTPGTQEPVSGYNG